MWGIKPNRLVIENSAKKSSHISGPSLRILNNGFDIFRRPAQGASNSLIWGRRRGGGGEGGEDISFLKNVLSILSNTSLFEVNC